jgi:cobalt/nickel transport system permease protein
VLELDQCIEEAQMFPTLHIPDGFLAPEVSIALWIATALVIAIALRRVAAEHTNAPARTVLMGIAGAFIFAAQMFNFPVAAGTSGHLLGGVLAGVLLGPWAGSIVMATVIGIQALLFQDGGLLVLGANIFNMGVIGTLGGSLFARGMSTALGGSRWAEIAGVGFAAWLSVMAAAGLTTLQLGISGTTDIGIGLPAMLGTHALIGVGEALITIAAIGFISATAPDILRARSSVRGASATRRIALGAGIALITVSLASLFASASPDGLERVAEDLGFLDLGQGPTYELLPDYTIPGIDGTISTILAGAVGVLIVVVILLLLGRVAARRRSA